ncbi:MAG: glycosyltransferase family 2 protein [Rhodospirillales bacterium]|nr:glycosyltransferase family 2 protein [Rhodospirillales bacterium]MCB9995996.1 glycosyltransferase family 2 protein [Rhodospirillales bacterium]
MVMSIVVPVKNEQENIEPLLAEMAVLQEKVPVSEVVYVDDGSTDGTLETLKGLWEKYPFLRVISHDRSAGQSAALWTGIKAAGNDIIVTIDGDGQNDPADIALLYEVYQKNARADQPVMVVGQRKKRQDNVVRRLSSRVANGVRSFLLRDGTRDTGCSLKLFRRQDYIKLPYFNHMHRFLPALMVRQGVSVCHVDVSHRPRTRGVSKYGMWDRLWVGIADIFGVMWLQRRACPPITILEE